MKILPPVLVACSVVAMVVLHAAMPGPVVVAGPLRWLGAAAMAGGFGLAFAVSRLFAARRTNINTFKDPAVLVTDGPFRVTRNPIYLGFAVFLFGLAVVLGSALPFGVALAFVVVADRWYIPFEEQAMRRTFGAAYDGYAARVRRWL